MRSANVNTTPWVKQRGCDISIACSLFGEGTQGATIRDKRAAYILQQDV